MKAEDLGMAIYLNQRVILDYLAIFNDGFSVTQQVKNATSFEKEKSVVLSGEIGITNAFGLFNLGIKPEIKSGTAETTGTETVQEKIHTPGSLFHKVRQSIIEQGLLKNIESNSTIISGDFIEFSAIIRKNPLLDYMERLSSLLEFATIFSPETLASAVPVAKGQQKPKHKQNPMVKMKQQMSALLNGLTADGAVDLIAEPIDADYKIVLTAESKFFQNEKHEEIIDGEYRILGKVIRLITKGQDESINLLRKTTLGSLNSDFILKTFSQSMMALPEHQFKQSDLFVEVNGPAILVVPIAICG